MPARAAVVCK